ncbi:MAG: ferrous iron transport protein A [Clostridia bacterium]|nr:ferrous iron transport protein A [Clostridia bacterium]
MMPLSFATPGETATIKKIGGLGATRAHLENLGFVVGGDVTVINTINGNLIVNIKESRIAISKEMASKIYI